MNIQEQFNLIAKEYDAGRKKFIPCFQDFYGGTTDFLASGMVNPGKILDLGAGTGLLTMFWYRHFPDAQYQMVDIAGDMLAVAGERFQGLENISCLVADYTRDFPAGQFDVIMSALSIHHLEDSQKQKLFQKVLDNLVPGGLFVNYDQFSAGSGEWSTRFDSYWEKYIRNSGLSDKEIELWQERRKLDKECSVEMETEMLQKAGFKTIKCIYTYQKFSVLTAIK